MLLSQRALQLGDVRTLLRMSHLLRFQHPLTYARYHWCTIPMRLDCPLRRCLSKIVSVLAATSLVYCMTPAVAFAGESATAAEHAANDAVIQEAIDGLGELEAGEDYTTGEVLVTYSGQDQPQSVELSDGQSVADALEDAKADNMVTAAQPNYIYRLMDTVPDSAAGEGAATANDKLLAGQYYLGDESVIGGETVYGADVGAAWKLAKSNNSTTVAVLDTGVQLSHEDLQDNIDRAHMATVTSDGRVNVGSMKDEDGHGTHVAGILSATANNAIGIIGASYNATVLPIRVFENHTSTTLQCIAGITYRIACIGDNIPHAVLYIAHHAAVFAAGICGRSACGITGGAVILTAAAGECKCQSKH